MRQWCSSQLPEPAVRNTIASSISYQYIADDEMVIMKVMFQAKKAAESLEIAVEQGKTKAIAKVPSWIIIIIISIYHDQLITIIVIITL